MGGAIYFPSTLFKNRHLLWGDDLCIWYSILTDKPTVIFTVVKDIIHINRIILDLVKSEIPLCNKHLMIFIRRYIRFFKKRKTLRHIDWKQSFYDDVLSGKTKYYSNLINSEKVRKEWERKIVLLWKIRYTIDRNSIADFVLFERCN